MARKRVVRGGQVTVASVDAAQQARREPTAPERRAWQILRGRGLQGLKFRREQVIDGFRVDFYCPELRLALEIDGGVHEDPVQRAYDLERSQHLRTLGIRVLRVRNEQISRVHLEQLLASVAPPGELA